MDTGGTRGDEGKLTERQRECQARREAAVRVLKERGIWQRLLDGKHTLRYIYSGIIEIDYLDLDEAAAALKITGTKHSAIDLPYIAFVLIPGLDGRYDDWFSEGSPEYEALEALMVDC